MIDREIILLIDDESTITDALAMLLERRGRTTIVCSDIESAEMALDRYAVTHMVTDVQFSSAYGFEGLHFIGRIRARLPECRIVLMTGRATHDLRATALTWGADAVLSKPFEIDELESASGLATGDGEGADYEVVRIPSLDQIFKGRMLRSAFQPIVALRDGGSEVFGYEALARVNGEWAGGGAAALFEYSARRGRLADLNVAALTCAIESASSVPGHAALFVNLDPTAFVTHDLPGVIRAAALRSGLSLSRLVLEITERSAFADAAAVTPIFDELRAEGVRFALDDHGSAYSHLAIVSRLRPSFVKISQTFGTDLERDPARERIVAHIASLARDFGCRTVLEGIESRETALLAATLGIELGQGFYYGRPQPAACWSAAPVDSPH